MVRQHEHNMFNAVADCNDQDIASRERAVDNWAPNIDEDDLVEWMLEPA